MECPACQRKLQELKVSDIVVDVCQSGCGGIWFDNYELQKVDEQHETAGEQLLNIERDQNIKVDYSKARICPKCEGQKMQKHFSSIKLKVEIDECPACGGIWLDCGELGQIRNEFATEEERNRAAKANFAQLLAPLKEESQKQSQKTKQIANTLRFICPSYYIPGKQDWGAF